MPDQDDEKARLNRRASHEAITLAMQNRWQEAIAVNEGIIEGLPADIDAYNRLGRAYMELGSFNRAREAYGQALGLDPSNAIAQKNLNRLSLLSESDVPVKEERRKVSPDLFIGEMGKAGVVNLQNLASQEVLAKMASGDQVCLKVEGKHLIVENELGEYLGQVESQHGFRLTKLMEGGNDYTAAIVSLDSDKARVIIREVFQHPSQMGKLSFPIKSVEGFHPHVRDTLLRSDAGEEETLDEADESETEERELLPEGFSIFERVIPNANGIIEEDLMKEE